MALSFSLAPNPKWYIADLVGLPLGGGYLATFSNLNHSIINPVFTDASGTTTWPYVTIPNVGKLGVLFDDNGSQGPFYFQLNSAVPEQLYYLEVYDSAGVLQWTINNFTPGSGGGAGPIITTALNLNNLVTNSAMLNNNIGDTPVAGAMYLKVAPGAHSGLSKATSNNGPDIVFLKNNLAAADTLNFVNFAQGDTFPNGEPTPVNYLHYVSGVGAGETQKCVQFPITHGVQNIQNQAVTVSIFARCTSGNTSLTLNWLQFFGEGPAASASTPFAIQTLTLTNTWQKFVIVPPGSTIPSTTGKSIGECGNDGLFLQVQYPLTVATTIDFTLPSAYMGSIVPEADFSPNDQINSVIYGSPRTGYIIQGLDAETIGGYVPMNDGTIGNAASGATNRHNIDTFPLYNMIYTNVIDAWAPVSGGRTGSAVNDFVAGKTLTLTRALGRVLGTFGSGAGLTARVLGEYLGEETHAMTLAELVPHHHQYIQPEPAGVGGSPNGGRTTSLGDTTTTGSGTPFNIMQPTSFFITYIKL